MKILYCRGCNREFSAEKETAEHYIERTEKGMKYHPKVDCDEIETQEDV